MFRVAVCDDSLSVLEQIKKLILDVPDISCRIDTYSSAAVLLEQHMCYDLIFLDIDMPGIGGIEAARAIREYDKKVKIAYVTSYRDFAAQAFSVHAFSYMIKPVSPEKIQKILREAFEYCMDEDNPVQVEFDTINGSIILNTKDIYYFEYVNRKIRICTKGGEFILKGKITDIYNKMHEFDFEMPHKSYVVNMFHIKSIVGNDIYMTNGDRVFLSQKRASAFRQIVCDYIEKQMG